MQDSQPQSTDNSGSDASDGIRRKPVDCVARPNLIARDAFIAPGATVLGKVHIGEKVNIWFGAVMRGDTEPIHIGSETNVQDVAVLHADPGFPCILGKRVTIGHSAIVHGATVEDDALIGIRAVVLNGATIGAGSIIGAGAVVMEGATIPPGSLAVGTPAKVIRQVTDADRRRMSENAKHYVHAGQVYRENFAGRVDNTVPTIEPFTINKPNQGETQLD